MLDRISTAAFAPSRKPTDRSADHLVSEENNRWFADICDQLVPKDAGLALRIATGFEERTCYRYAAADRKPPGYFIRALLRSDGGWQWLCALMEGADADWFDDLQRARRIADAIAAVERNP